MTCGLVRGASADAANALIGGDGCEGFAHYRVLLSWGAAMAWGRDQTPLFSTRVGRRAWLGDMADMVGFLALLMNSKFDMSPFVRQNLVGQALTINAEMRLNLGIRGS